MHIFLQIYFSNFRRCEYIFVVIQIFIYLKHVKSAQEVKGIAYIDDDKPYQSYVGKILPNRADSDGENLSNIIDRFTNSKKPVVVDPKSHPSKPQGRGMGKPNAHKKAKPKIKALKPKSQMSKNQHDNEVLVMTPPKGKGKGHKKSKGRTIDKGNSNDKDKPNWYFKDPKKLLGRTITNYEPSDPNEPRPSEKIKEGDSSGGVEAESKAPGTGEGAGNGDESKGPDPGKGIDNEAESKGPDPAEAVDVASKNKTETPSGSPGKKKKKTDVIVDNPNRKLPKVIEFKDSDKMNPDSPGWFALKETSKFGKPLKLGSLLRRRGKLNSTDARSEEVENVDDADDGENNDAAERMSSMLRKYDKACLWQEYQATKATLIGSRISESIRDKVRWQNQQLAYFFMDLAFNAPVDEFSNSSQLYGQQPQKAYQLLHLTKEIFTNQICKEKVFGEGDAAKNSAGPAVKDKILPKPFIETVYHLFLKLFEITKNKQSTEYLSESEFEWIKGNLESCNQTGGLPKKILWYTDECKETVVAFDQENNYACTPYIEYDFNIRKYDPLLDLIWHMVASVHSHCFESFQTNIRLWHRYTLAIADLVTPEMRVRWSASSEDNRKLYTRFFGPNYEIYFDNMNRCMYAATLRSNVPYLLPRFDGSRKTRFAPYSVQQFNATEF